MSFEKMFVHLCLLLFCCVNYTFFCFLSGYFYLSLDQFGDSNCHCLNMINLATQLL